MGEDNLGSHHRGGLYESLRKLCPSASRTMVSTLLSADKMVVRCVTREGRCRHDYHRQNIGPKCVMGVAPREEIDGSSSSVRQK